MIDFKHIFDRAFLQNMTGKSEVYVVGGAVRDMVMGISPKDIDIVVCNVPVEELINHLEKFGKVDLVGESFGVIKFRDVEDDEEFDIALPRTDKKDPTQKGHRAIEVQSDHTLSITDDLGRRDFTINALAVDRNNKLIDPFGGLLHIYNREIHAVSNEVFIDDPLRMIRAIQFAARFNFNIENSLGDLIMLHAELIREITPERVLDEFVKVFNKGGDAVYFGHLLDRSGLWEQFFGRPINYKYAKYENLAGFLFSCASEVDDVAAFYTEKLKIDRDLRRKIEAYQIWFKEERTDENPDEWVGFKALQKSNVVIQYVFDDHPCLPSSFSRLAIDGDDLLKLGFTGKEIGDALKSAVIAVGKEELRNEYNDLEDFLLSKKETVNL